MIAQPSQHSHYPNLQVYLSEDGRYHSAGFARYILALVFVVSAIVFLHSLLPLAFGTVFVVGVIVDSDHLHSLFQPTHPAYRHHTVRTILFHSDTEAEIPDPVGALSLY